MKISISPSDIRQANEALSRCAAARQWAHILQKMGVDPKIELERVEAAERIAQGFIDAAAELEGQPL